MDRLSDAALLALRLIATGDHDVLSALSVSLSVTISATIIACMAGAPLGAWLAMRDFPGRRVVLVGVNAGLGLPPVAVGLVVYLLLSRAGPLGSWGLIFTPQAMVICQLVLTLPIAVALTHRATEVAWRDYGDALRIDGARTMRSIGSLLAMESGALLTAFLATFGRAISEVGAILIAGGNIRDHTRSLTTALVLETSKGDIALAMALGMILVGITLVVSVLAFKLQGSATNS